MNVALKTTVNPSVSRILAVCAVALMPWPVLAQQQRPSSDLDAESVLGEVLDVRVVNLEAVVTDRDGQRVQGLTPEDFRLTVDGRETEITYFSEIEAGAVSASSESQPGLQSPPAVTADGAAGTNFLLYVDDNHTIKRERDILVKHLIADLKDLGRNDRMAIVAQSGTGLVTLAGWTQDPVVLEAALQRLLDASDFGGVFRSPIRTARRTSLSRSAASIQTDFAYLNRQQNAIRGLPSLSEGRFLGNPADLPSLPSANDFGLNDRVGQLIDLEFALSGALSTLRGFDQPVGRKVMLMMTGEWPIGNFRRGTSSFNTLTEMELMDPLIETANLLGYTLYPVNEDSSSSIWRNATFSRVAQRTGGRTLSNRTAILTEAVTDTSSYYWLGFAPDLIGSNQNHRVKLELRNGNYKVRSRRGYVDLSSSAQLAMDAQGALLFGDVQAGGEIEMIFGQSQKAGLRRMSVPVTIRVPLALLTAIPVRGEDQIELEVRFAVVNENGATAEVPTLTRILRGENRSGDVYEFQTELIMRRVPHEVLVSIYDRATGQTLMTRGSVGPQDV